MGTATTANWNMIDESVQEETPRIVETPILEEGLQALETDMPVEEKLEDTEDFCSCENISE